uniref:Uncharacterized protein n=1 Tax=Pinguiococcus pyrenoidosus TaxID=172671 RepID=A0A7R9YD01_9STRA|mmetsp:Transcript_260/g.1073  ORF Transcript_260/g.1073 Transcript_260/m.1073 type:complete len:206 (+) Transcript_260:80-697(+)
MGSIQSRDLKWRGDQPREGPSVLNVYLKRMVRKWAMNRNVEVSYQELQQQRENGPPAVFVERVGWPLWHGLYDHLLEHRLREREIIGDNLSPAQKCCMCLASFALAISLVGCFVLCYISNKMQSRIAESKSQLRSDLNVLQGSDANPKGIMLALKERRARNGSDEELHEEWIEMDCEEADSPYGGYYAPEEEGVPVVQGHLVEGP